MGFNSWFKGLKSQRSKCRTVNRSGNEGYCVLLTPCSFL